jgi:hypothetical protein
MNFVVFDWFVFFFQLKNRMQSHTRPAEYQEHDVAAASW